MKLKRMFALLLALALVLALAGCGKSAADPTPTAVPSENPTPSETVTPDETPEPTPAESAERTAVRLAVLSGPTGVGAAKLLSEADDGSSKNDYQYVIAADNSELVAGLTKGEIDIATVASNVALNLYNKTEGGVRIIALGTRGVLHILEGKGGNSIQSVADLAGRTIYSPGQGANPEYILRYLLQQNGLDPDKDVTLVFADASEINAKLVSGDIDCAMLPVPAATAAILKGNGQVREAIDVTEAWNEMDSGSELIMTAVVARTEFIESDPEAVADFLTEYAASIDYVNTKVDEAAELIAGYGITPSAAIAKQAIPQCHLVFIAGADMAPAVSDYFSVLYELDPASVGGALPDDAIYYVP